MSEEVNSEERERLAKSRYLDTLRERVRLQQNLPFWYDAKKQRVNAHKLYQWQIDFFNSKNRISLLTAANQIGKSSIQIIKALNLGLREEFWPLFFKRRPQMFLYYMPDQKTFDVEFQEKWVKTYLPKADLQDHETFGWRADYGKPTKKEEVTALHLNTGVSIYFRTYSQLPSRTQAVTADLVLLDEECPKSHWDELMVRSQTFGLVSMVFTATLGSEYLYQAMMLQGTDRELFKDAWKRMISMYECIQYADGTDSPFFSKERIEKEIIPSFSSQDEIDKRVFGKFVKTSGLIFQEFNEARNTCDYEIDKDWRWVAGLDYGSGGDHGHPSAICFVQVSPCNTKARVVRTWWSGKARVTQGDLLDHLARLMKEIGLDYIEAYYDWAAADLGELAAREGVALIKAEKSYEIGIPLMNSLFKNRQLKICIGGDSLQNFQLVTELRTIREATKKKNRKDDCADAARYALSKIPFLITPIREEEEEKPKEEVDPRMRFWKGLDLPGDPMKELEEGPHRENYDLEFEEALKDFEEIL